MQIDERLQQGISAHRSGNLEAALSAYKDVLSEDPDHADGLHFLGLLHFDAGKADNAVALIHASLERTRAFLRLEQPRQHPEAFGDKTKP